MANLKKSRRRHKPSPEVPYYVWLDLDGCWFCKHQNGCNNCKVLKRYSALEKEHMENTSFNLIIVDNNYIHELNKNYRHIDV